MCQYTILANRSNACIRYCHECMTYNLQYNNLLLNFDAFGFEDFKVMLSDCYDHHIENHCPRRRQTRDIIFNTPKVGVQFIFSTAEVGDLLALFQKAELKALTLDCGSE